MNSWTMLPQRVSQACSTTGDFMYSLHCCVCAGLVWWCRWWGWDSDDAIWSKKRGLQPRDLLACVLSEWDGGGVEKIQHVRDAPAARTMGNTRNIERGSPVQSVVVEGDVIEAEQRSIVVNCREIVWF